MNDRIASTIPDKEKPPRRCPGGETSANWCFSALECVAARTILDLRGRDGQAHFLAEDARDESAHRMRLPAGGFHEIGTGGAARALQQAKELGGLATQGGRSRRLGRLGRLPAAVGLPRPGRLYGRLALGWRDAARVSGDAGALGGSWFPRWGTRVGFFWNFVHIAFSLGGDYRDDHIHCSGSGELQAKSHEHPSAQRIGGTC